MIRNKPCAIAGYALRKRRNYSFTVAVTAVANVG